MPDPTHPARRILGQVHTDRLNRHTTTPEQAASLGHALALASAEICGDLTREQISEVTARWRP